jgi:GNAT superfamily N-acetyltransferase
MNAIWKSEVTADKTKIRAYLESDRLYAAYALGDLEPDLFPQSTFALAERESRPQALAMCFRGLEPPALFLMGDAAGVADLLGRSLHPHRASITCRDKHLPVVERFFGWEAAPRPMVRMALNRKRFRPAEGNCLRLTREHTRALSELVELGKVTGFSPAQIPSGVFFGIFEGERLAAAAGTHLVSPGFGVAAIGNVVTHPEFRKRGYGTAVVGAVAGELVRRGIPDIVLNVHSANASATRIYEKLGFERYCLFYEGNGFLLEPGKKRK